MPLLKTWTSRFIRPSSCAERGLGDLRGSSHDVDPAVGEITAAGINTLKENPMQIRPLVTVVGTDVTVTMVCR